jgi:hypothetical protein
MARTMHIPAQSQRLSRSIVLIFVLCLLALSEARNITAEGWVPYSGDHKKDLEGAKGIARRSAIEQVLGVAVEAQTHVERMQLIKSVILTRSKGFIFNERLVSEKREGDRYIVAINCDVEETNILEELARISNKIIIRITENGMSNQSHRSDLELMLREHLVDNEFNCIDWEYVSKVSHTFSDSEMSLEEIKTMGNFFLAQILIYGDVKIIPKGQTPPPYGYTEKNNPYKGMLYVEADLDIRAVDTSSGVLVAEWKSYRGDYLGYGFDYSAAIQDANSQVAEVMSTYFIEKLRANEKTIIVRLSGIKDLAQYDKICAVIFSDPVICRVDSVVFTGTNAELGLSIKSSVNEFALALEKIPKPKFKVSKVSDNSIDAALK